MPNYVSYLQNCPPYFYVYVHACTSMIVTPDLIDKIPDPVCTYLAYSSHFQTFFISSIQISKV